MENRTQTMLGVRQVGRSTTSSYEDDQRWTDVALKDS